MKSDGDTIQVAAGMVRNPEGRILLSRRPPGGHLPGAWEFPGGKLDPGETPESGLIRELEEELGIRVDQSRPLMSVTHDYPEKRVRLWLREVTGFSGLPEGREGQELRWTPIETLADLDMPAADRPVARMLEQDPVYVISADPADFARRGDFIDRWRGCLESGARLLRLRGRPGSGLEALAAECAALAAEYGAHWMWSGPPGQARALGADGIHLSSHQLGACRRRPLPESMLVGASCHNAAEIRKAGNIGADFIALSPVAATTSHPRAEPLGWKRFGELVAESPLPIFALGGMRRTDLPRVRELGGFGVAGISAFGWPG